MNQPSTPSASPAPAASSSGGALLLAWAFVGIPLAWGVFQTFIKALALFQ